MIVRIIIKHTFVSYNDPFSNSVQWHARLGHISQDRMNRLAKEGLLDRLTKVKLLRCESCLAGKATTNLLVRLPEPQLP